MIVLDLLKTVYSFPNARMIIEWMGTVSSKPGDHKSKMGGVTLTWKWGVSLTKGSYL